MKKITPFIMILLLSVILFSDVSLITAGASEGLVLWLYTVIPSLFPFLFLSSYMLNSGFADILAGTVGRRLSNVLRISPVSSIALLCGMLFGCPAGAKCIVDLQEKDQITLREAEFLLSFCNNTSPAFLVSYCVTEELNRPDLILPSVFVFYTGIFFCAFFFRFTVFRSLTVRRCQSAERRKYMPPAKNMDASIESGCSILIRLGGYLMLFSILIRMLKMILPGDFIGSSLLLASMEMTNGIHIICGLKLSFCLKYALSLWICTFGGWCCVLQTQSVAGCFGFSLKSYIKEKLVTATATSFIAFIFICLTE